MIRHIATLIDGLARTIRIHEDEYDKLLCERGTLRVQLSDERDRWQKRVLDLIRERDTLRNQLFEAREQRDEARDILKHGVLGTTKYDPEPVPSADRVSYGVDGSATHWQAQAEMARATALELEKRWQGCLDVANRNAAEARGEADRLRAQLFETREQRDEAREREITFKTQAHFAAQQRDNALRPTNPIIAEVEALLRERLKDYVRK